MAQKLNPFSGVPHLDANGDPRVGAKLFSYIAGSSSKVTLTKDLAGTSNHDNPIILNSEGLPGDGAGAAQLMWQAEGITVKLVLAPPGDTDPPVAAISTWDNLSGINDALASSAQDEWVSGPTPTFVSTISFILVGDQTTNFHVGRRLKTTNSGGTLYSSITAVVFTSLTTVTVANDSTVLDSGLSAVSYATISSVNSSSPAVLNHTISFSKGVDIASATDLVTGNDGNYFDVTGTTNITSINAIGVGTILKLHFDDALILTHDATNLDLDGDSDITTVAGDEMEFIEYAAGDWRQTGYSPFSNVALNEGQMIVKQQDFVGLEAWVPRNHISGLIMSTGTDTDHDVDVTVGEATDSDNDHMLKLTATATVAIDIAFGTGDGGLASSLTVANTTWYHYFIVKIGTAACKVGIDTSLTAANLVTDHSITEFRYIGSRITNGSANIIAAFSYEMAGGGVETLWADPVLDISVTDQSTTAVARTLTVPTGRSVISMLNIRLADTDTTDIQFLYVRNPDVNDEAPSATVAPLATLAIEVGTNSDISGPHHIRTSTSSQVETRTAGTGDATLDIATIGWIDSRI